MGSTNTEIFLMNRITILALALLAMGNLAYGQDKYAFNPTAPTATPKTEAKAAAPTADKYAFTTAPTTATPTAKIETPTDKYAFSPTTASKTDDKTPTKDPGSPTFDDGLDSTIGSYAAWGHSGGGYGYGRSYGNAGRTNGTSSYSHSSVGRTHIAGTHGGSFRTNGYHSGGSWAGYTPPSYRPYVSGYSAYRPSYGAYSYAGTGYGDYNNTGFQAYTPSYGAYSFAGSGTNTGGLPYSYAGAAYFWTEADGSVSRLDLQAYQQRMRYYCWYHGINSDGDDRTIGSQAKTALPKNVVTDDGLSRTVGTAATVTPTTPVAADDGLDKK